MAEDAVRKELLASQICRCFDIKQVKYEEYYFEGERVTQSNLVTSKRYSMVSKMVLMSIHVIMNWIQWRYVKHLIRILIMV